MYGAKSIETPGIDGMEVAVGRKVDETAWDIGRDCFLKLKKDLQVGIDDIASVSEDPGVYHSSM
jgi:hypothetical protein